MNAVETNRPRPSAATLAALRGLQEILDTQSEGYRRLLSTIERQREAVRTADLALVPEIAEVQRKIVERLAVLDGRREVAGRALATEMGIDPESGVSAIAALLPIAAADRLEVRAAELRGLVEQARREQSLLKSAGEALAKHMAGIVQSVTGALSGTGVYGRRGRLREGAPLVAGLDLTS
ncbi:MAG: flagellar protein FlgN [Phycisphaera sp.]|nr:flagellar protein FlgN [Phycisphaera sp.]